MAKFTAPVDLNIRLPGGFEAVGVAGTTHRLPDALVEEFVRDVVPGIPGGVTWITQDEATAAQAAIDDKYDKSGGTISGAVTVTGALTAASVAGVVMADRYSSIAAAVAALPATGGTVHVPAGSYAISATISLPSNVRLTGVGAATRITQSANLPIIAVAASASGVSISNLAIIGSATTASTAAIGIAVQTAATDVAISNVSVSACWRAVSVVLASRVTVEDCLVTGDQSNLGAIDINASSSVTVRGCRIISPATHGIDFREGSVDCLATGCSVTTPGSTGFVISTNCQRCAVASCQSTGGQHGVVVEIGSLYSLIEGNRISGPSTNGVLVSAAGSTHPAATIIRGNAIAASAGRGIWNSGGDHTVIEGNAVVAYGTDGIRTNGTNNYATIMGNSISGGTSTAGRAIVVDSSATDCTISGNNVHDVAGEGILADGTNCSITGNTVIDCDNGGVLTIGGITLGANASRSVVTGNTSRRTTGTKQDYGVVVKAGCTNALVAGNILFQNSTGGISDSGTGTVTTGANVTT